MFSKIDTVHICVRDLDQSINWYEEVLELENLFYAGKYVVFRVGLGNTTITIQEGEVRPSSIKPILFSDALEETRLKLLEKDVEAGAIESDGEVTFFEFKDLDGNIFEVCHFD
ncbi:VOC family protein [Rossellomorea aquimaris]|uniref:VOC family protein n=1 Tax=Rossellomorea aquimaris TaxID=189382 RepID=UPI0007D0A697|nr:VOC family protein [Rossellomorea aquimaris]